MDFANHCKTLLAYKVLLDMVSIGCTTPTNWWYLWRYSLLILHKLTKLLNDSKMKAATWLRFAKLLSDDMSLVSRVTPRSKCFSYPRIDSSQRNLDIALLSQVTPTLLLVMFLQPMFLLLSCDYCCHAECVSQSQQWYCHLVSHSVVSPPPAQLCNWQSVVAVSVTWGLPPSVTRQHHCHSY